MRRGMRTGGVRGLAGLAALVGIVVLASGCSLFPLAIDESADGTLQTVRVGDAFRIELPGNISTGFQWIRVSPASLEGSPLEAIEEGEFRQDDAHVCGGPGTFRFRYRAVAAGTVELRFWYAMPWELEPADAVSIIVWVK